MIEVIKTDHGTFNLMGIDDGMFILQGSLTKPQLKELVRQANKALKGGN